METLKERKIPVIAIIPDETEDLTLSDVQNQFIEDLPLTDTEDILEENLKGVESFYNDDTDIEEFEIADDENVHVHYIDEARVVSIEDSLDHCGMYDESFQVKDGSSKKMNLIKSQSVCEYVYQEEEDLKQLTDYEDIVGSDFDNDDVAYDEDEKVLIKILDDQNHVIDISDKLRKSPSEAALTPQLSPKWYPSYCPDRSTSQKNVNRPNLTPTPSNNDYRTECELLVSDSESFKREDRKRKRLHKLKSDKRNQRKTKSLEIGPRQIYEIVPHGDSSTEDDITFKENVNLLTITTQTDSTNREEIILSSKEKEQYLLPKAQGDKVELCTDVVIIETENEVYVRPKSPEPSDEESALPEPTRLMTLVKEESSGKTVDINFPLGDAQPDGLYNPVKDSLSDVEVFELENNVVEDVCTFRYPTPPILDNLEGAIIESSERSIVLSPTKKAYNSKVTTSEKECFQTEKRRKNKCKLKSVSEMNIELSNLNVLTDTEELYLSDVEIPRRVSHPTVSREIDDNPLTDIDDICFSNEEEEELKRLRSFSLTPVFLNEFTGDTFTTAKENDCPLSCEQKRQILDVELPHSRLVRTPDIPGAQHTDTEDIVGSADESFLESGPEIRVVEDDSFESTVHMKQSRKMDFESNEEMMHAKNGALRESHTDVEDVEDDDIRLIHDLSILENESKFCVCANTNESVCICFGKPLNELTIEWDAQEGKNAEKGSKKSIILKTTCSLNYSNQKCSKVISFQVDSSSHSLVAQQISSKNKVVMSLFYNPRNGPFLRIPYVDFYLQIKSSSVRTELKINLLRNEFYYRNISSFYVHIPQKLKIQGNLRDSPPFKFPNKKRQNYLTVRSLSGDLVLPGNITFYKDTTINVSELVSKFEVFNKDSFENVNLKGEEKQNPAKLSSPVKIKPLFEIDSLKDRSINPERLKPSSIKNSPAFKAIIEIKETTSEDNDEKVKIGGRITEKIGLFEKLSKTSDGILKRSSHHLRRTLSFPSRKGIHGGKKYLLKYIFWWWLQILIRMGKILAPISL